MRIIVPLLLIVGACSNKETLPELYLLEGACEVAVTTTEKHSDIFVDGILVGHGQAKTHAPCGEKKIEIEAEGKKRIEDYQTAVLKIPLEVNYTLEKFGHAHDWGMSPELVEQLKKGQGPYNIHNPKFKELAALNAKARDDEGFNYSPKELADAAKKLLGGPDTGATGGAIVIDPNTNFDDPKTWL